MLSRWANVNLQGALREFNRFRQRLSPLWERRVNNLSSPVKETAFRLIAPSSDLADSLSGSAIPSRSIAVSTVLRMDVALENRIPGGWPPTRLTASSNDTRLTASYYLSNNPGRNPSRLLIFSTGMSASVY